MARLPHVRRTSREGGDGAPVERGLHHAAAIVVRRGDGRPEEVRRIEGDRERGGTGFERRGGAPAERRLQERSGEGGGGARVRDRGEVDVRRIDGQVPRRHRRGRDRGQRSAPDRRLHHVVGGPAEDVGPLGPVDARGVHRDVDREVAARCEGDDRPATLGDLEHGSGGVPRPVDVRARRPRCPRGSFCPEARTSGGKAGCTRPIRRSRPGSSRAGVRRGAGGGRDAGRLLGRTRAAPLTRCGHSASGGERGDETGERRDARPRAWGDWMHGR